MSVHAADLEEFLRLNRDASKGHANEDEYILVDAAYRDPYIVTCTLKIAQCAARLTNRALVVVTAPGIPESTAQIVSSFRPRRIVAVRDLALRGALTRLGPILAVVGRTRTGDELASLVVDGMLVGPHLYDALLMRFGLPTIDTLSPILRMHLLAELCILEGFRRLVADRPPALGVLPDDVYRAGALFEVLAHRRTPMLAGLDMNGLSVHYYPSDGSFTDHCRTPDQALIEQVVRTPALMEQAEDYLRRRTSGDQAQHDVKRAYSDAATSVDRSRLCEIMKFTGFKPIVMITAHIFCDAPHAYVGLIFKDYQAWLLETCRLLRANTSVEFFVKEHPSAELYGEQGLTERILRDAGVADHFLPVQVNTRTLFSSVDTVITCGGTAGSEFPCFGVPVLLAASSPYDRLGYVRRAHTIGDYEREIGRLQTYERLGVSEIRRAKAALFVMHAVMKVAKAELGLGSQPFMRGSELDFSLFLREAAEDIRTQSGYARLTTELKHLFGGPYQNMIDRRLTAPPPGAWTPPGQHMMS